jgi:hypothetical protein
VLPAESSTPDRCLPETATARHSVELYQQLSEKHPSSPLARKERAIEAGSRARASREARRAESVPLASWCHWTVAITATTRASKASCTELLKARWAVYRVAWNRGRNAVAPARKAAGSSPERDAKRASVFGGATSTRRFELNRGTEPFVTTIHFKNNSA